MIISHLKTKKQKISQIFFNQSIIYTASLWWCWWFIKHWFIQSLVVVVLTAFYHTHTNKKNTSNISKHTHTDTISNQYAKNLFSFSDFDYFQNQCMQILPEIDWWWCAYIQRQRLWIGHHVVCVKDLKMMKIKIIIFFIIYEYIRRRGDEQRERERGVKKQSIIIIIIEKNDDDDHW